MISTLRDRLFRADAEPHRRVLESEAEGFRFFHGLLVGFALSVLLYAGLGTLLWSLLT
jgi:hypothetical protein